LTNIKKTTPKVRKLCAAKRLIPDHYGTHHGRGEGMEELKIQIPRKKLAKKTIRD
jgi:hypothetical protein